jgi:hypothetical protein
MFIRTSWLGETVALCSVKPSGWGCNQNAGTASAAALDIPLSSLMPSTSSLTYRIKQCQKFHRVFGVHLTKVRSTWWRWRDELILLRRNIFFVLKHASVHFNHGRGSCLMLSKALGWSRNQNAGTTSTRLPPQMVPVYLVTPLTSLGQCPLHRTTYPNPRQPWQSLSFPNTRCRMNQSTRQEGPLKQNPLAYHQKQCTLHYHHQNITHSLHLMTVVF